MVRHMNTSPTCRSIALAACTASLGLMLLGCGQRLEPFERAAAHAGIDAVERYDDRPAPSTWDPAKARDAHLTFRVAVEPGDPVAAKAKQLAGNAASPADPFVWFPVAEQATWRDVGRTLSFPETNPVPRDDTRLGIVTAQHGHMLYILTHNTLSRSFGPDTLPGYRLESAEVTYDIRSRPSVSFFFDGPTGAAFSEWTARNAGERIAAIVDGWVVVTPRVNGPMAGSGMITGVFPLTDAEELARRLMATEPVVPAEFEE